MSHHYVHVIVPKAIVDDVIGVAAIDGVSAVKGPMRTVQFLATGAAQQQQLFDELQRALFQSEDWQIAINPVEAVIAKSPATDASAEGMAETREALLSQISQTAGVSSVYLALVLISAVVAALGMIGSNIAATIDAMMMAPSCPCWRAIA